MKTTLSILAALIMAGQLFAQSPLAQAKPVGSVLWGYINPEGEFVIQPSYRICNPFTEDGLAPSTYDKSRKSFFFIQTDGEELKTELDKFVLMNFKGFDPKGFRDGMAPVQVKNDWGYMNTEGKLVVPAVYDKAREFDSNHGVVAKDKKFYIVDRTGNEKQLDLLELVDVRRFSEGLAPIRVGAVWGFISTDGSVAIVPSFKSVGYFSEGMAWAKNTAGQTGFIDKKGNWVIEAKYETTKDFSNGLARVKSGNWTFVDKTGKTIATPSADSFGDFSDGLAYCKSAEKVGFIDKTGKLVIPQEFSKVRDFKNGYAAAQQGEKWGFIDKTGKWAIEPKFDAVKDFEATTH